jgi:hypothetical protein
MSSTTPTPNDLTRQQLDELDALLQRMLSLPLNAPPAPAPVPVPAVQPAPSVSLPAGWRADTAAVPSSRQSHFTNGSIEEAEELLERVAAMAVPLMATATAQPMTPPPVQNLAEPPARMFAPPTPDTGVPPSAGPLRGVDAPALPMGYRPPTESPFATTPVPAPALFPQSEPVPTEEPFAELTPATPTPTPAKTETARSGGVPVVLWPLFAVNWVMELLLGLLGPVGAVLTHPAMKHLLGVAGLALLAGAGAWAARGMGLLTW